MINQVQLAEQLRAVNVVLNNVNIGVKKVGQETASQNQKLEDLKKLLADQELSPDVEVALNDLTQQAAIVQQSIADVDALVADLPADGENQSQTTDQE